MKCLLCPRKCGVDRTKNSGVCGATYTVKIAKYSLFSYEEPCISGNGGSGAIFFSSCSLKCVFCQNYKISTLNQGNVYSVEQLADIFKELEQKGADNINLVNPTHYVDQIIQAFNIYKPQIPIVYNSHGYENLETLDKIAPYVDVFLPDFKYFSNSSAKQFSNCANYVETVKNAIIKMRSLKQDIFVDGMIKSGVIIRHMIMPLLTDESIKILEWVQQNMPQTKVSLMAQYTPYAKACEYKQINRKITKREYNKVVDKYLELGLDGFVQGMESAETLYIPKWDI